MALIQQEGHVPSVAEVALRSNVSRATAYRYFPSRSALVTAAVNASLGPVRTFKSTQPDGRLRVRELFLQTFPRFKEFEPQMRAAAQLSLEHARAPFARSMPTVVFGIEPYLVLKDIWGMNDREVEQLALWMADALVNAALAEAAPRGTPRRVR
jgi:AcrR family transcriptional regulator